MSAPCGAPVTSSVLSCIEKAGLLPPLAVGHGAGTKAKEEQEEDGLGGRRTWGQAPALPTSDKLPTLSARGSDVFLVNWG